MRYVVAPLPSSGIPLGGLGAGSVEIRADGRLHEWLIFNNRPWGYGPEVPVDPEDLLFILRVLPEGGEPLVRVLALGSYEPLGDPYTLPWLRNVERIGFEGKPPLALLKYEDHSLAGIIEVRMEALSLLDPTDLKASSTPAAIFIFKLRNPGGRSVSASIAAVVRSPYRLIAGALPRNQAVREHDFAALLMTADGVPPGHGAHGGGLALGVLGSGMIRAGVRSLDDVRRLLVHLRAAGVIPETDSASARDLYGVVCACVELDPGEEAELIFVLAWFYPNHVDAAGKRIGHYYENFFSSPIDVLRYVARALPTIRPRVEALARTLHDVSYEPWLASLAASQITTLIKSSWFTKDGLFGIWEGGPGCCGLNTTDVALWGSIGVLLLFPELAKRMLEHTARFVLRPGLSPYYEAYALAFPENMALFRGMLAKDPTIAQDLEKLRSAIADIVRRTGKDPSGRVPHFFPGTFDYPDAYHMVDLMPAFILMAVRNAAWTGDLEHLRRLWDAVRMAFEAMLRQHDDLGLRLPYHRPPAGFESFSNVARELTAKLPETVWIRAALEQLFSGPMFLPTGFQTFDVWSHIGVSIFTSDLWLAALAALEHAARELGDESMAALCAKIREEATRNLVQLLWNGEYFELWNDPASGLRDPAVMSAALTGEWYLSMILGLGHGLDEDKVRSTLRAIVRHNLKPDEGLINGSYPGRSRPALAGDLEYSNGTRLPYRVGCQMDTPWTGVELSVGMQLIWEGMIDEGLRVLRALHERYARGGHYWNHIECGGHYFRSLCSLALYNALAGAHYDGLRARLTIAPRLKPVDFRGPVLIPGALLSAGYRERADHVEVVLTVVLGKVALGELRLPRVSRPASIEALVDGAPVKAEAVATDGGLGIKFEHRLVLGEGSRLVVRVHLQG